jgi:dolichyl-phosphate beta-glucosyltransferase
MPQMEQNGNQVQVSVVIPAYNEERKIADAVHDIVYYFEQKKLSYELIVSVDGTDRTREIVEDMAKGNPCIVLTGSSERRGKGMAVHEAILKSRGAFVGYMDADNKTPASEFDQFLPELEKGTPVVIGNRALSGTLTASSRPLARRVFSWAYLLFTHMLLGLWEITDTQCGFKFFQRDAGLELFRAQKIMGYAFDVEILYLARKKGYAIAQVPVSFKHDPDSRMSVILGNLRSLRDTCLIRFLHLND